MTTSDDDRGPIFVIGAGPSGLTAAHRLLRQGERPIVIESRDRVGGQVHTRRENGYLMETGATILPSAYKAVLDIVDEVGVTDELIPAGSVVGFCRDGEVHEMRSDHLFADGARTKIVSQVRKLALARLGIDNLRCGKFLNYEDLSSMADFDTMTPKEYCDKHLGLGGDVYDYVVNSTVRGVLGTRGDTSSVAELFFMINNILGTRLFAFRSGFSTFIEALAAPLDVRLGCTAHELVETRDGVSLTYTDAAGTTRTEAGSGAVVTTRGDLLPGLLPAYFDAACTAFLERLRYTKVVTMNTGVTKPPAGIAASVINVPEPVDDGLMGFTCEHNKAPGRAPDGHGLLCFLSMAEWAEDFIHQDDETIRREYLRRAEKIMPGITDTVDYTHITRWNECIVYSRPGLYRELGEFMARRPRSTRIQLGGIFFSSSNICTAVTAGERAVRELLPVVRAPRGGIGEYPYGARKSDRNDGCRRRGER